MDAPARSFFACSLHALHSRQLHDGLFDYPSPSTPATISVLIRLAEGELAFDLRPFIEQSEEGRAYLASLTVTELLQFGKVSGCRAELSNGHLYFRTEQPTSLDLSTCYVQRLRLGDDVLIPVIAFDETQPARYKAELVAVLKETSTSAPTV